MLTDRTLPVEVQRCSLRSGAGERIGETLGEEDWPEAWRRGLAKRIGEEEKEKEKQTALIESSNPHLAGGEKQNL